MFTAPWEHVPESDTALLAELKLELSKGHPMYDMKLLPVAKRIDKDDVCFREISSDTERYFEVHLTWSGKKEITPYPRHTEYFDFHSWFDGKCLKDQEEYGNE